MNAPLQLPILHTLSALTLAGVDARNFLQGQLSQDLRTLGPQRALLASCNSAQGRVQAVMTLIERDGQIIILLPASIIPRILPRLRNYLLRAKAILSNDPTLWSVATLTATQASAQSIELPISPGDIVRSDALTLMRWWSSDERYLVLAPTAAVDSQTTEDGCLQWRRADIAAGLPQVYPETYESFVAPMLNLDVLGGISFDKGCYTGQEIIARTHYRGTVKRRMFRFTGNCTPPDPGTRVLQGAKHAGDVVDAVGTATGCELLAALSIEHAQSPLHLDGIADSGLNLLSLPYTVPSLQLVTQPQEKAG